MKTFVNYRDKYGSATFIRNFSDSIVSVTLLDSVLGTVAVPDGAKMCIINGNDYWVSSVADFTIPTGAGALATTAEFEGAGYTLKGVTNLYFRSETGSKLTVAFYR